MNDQVLQVEALYSEAEFNKFNRMKKKIQSNYLLTIKIYETK